MMNRILLILAIAVSCTALYFSVQSGSSSQTESSSLMDERNDERIDGLIAKIDRLEFRLDEGLRAGGSGKGEVVDPLEDAGGVARLQERHLQLEKQLEKSGVIEQAAKRKQLVEESYKIAMDEDRSAKERLDVLGLLRDEGRLDAALVDSMMDVWDESSKDGKVGPYHRWALMENLRGSTNRRFRENLFSMLSEEPGAKMTGQAISALEPMLPDAAVEDWLLYLSVKSPDAAVQEQAGGALERGRKR